MELIPYTPVEGREIVLRHRNALVVRDASSRRLEIRGLALTECPTCHQPLRPSSPERGFDIPTDRDETYVDPNYFRMLQAGHDEDHRDQRPPPSPIRRLTQPTLPTLSHSHSGDSRIQEVEDAEFISSTPAPQGGARIRRNAFSPGYFKTFFVEETELGRGGKGVVLLVRHEIDRCQLGHFACKRVPVGDDHAWLEKVLVEVELLAKLSHPNLVSYRHVWLEDVKIHTFGPSVACAFILQQYCNRGDLQRYIIGDQPKESTKEQLKAQMRRRSKPQGERPQELHPGQRRLAFEEIYSLFKDITSGLSYLHEANYIHRDLKPSNCLLHFENNKMTCLISDFGEVQPENAVRKSTGTTGTISYCAPEVLKADTAGRYGNFTTKSDVFSLGMILYFMCFGHLPYRNANMLHEEEEDIDQLRAEITDWKGFQDERRERPDLPAKLYQLLKRMLALDPADRPSATEVLAIMNLENNIGGFRRDSRSGSPPAGLRSRVQNLDSPMPPATPTPDPRKSYVRDPNSEEEVTTEGEGPSFVADASPQPTPNNSLQKLPTTTANHYRSPSMALSRSQDGRLRRISPGQTSPHRQTSPGVSTPLLMPPPTTRLGEVQHRLLLTQHYAYGFVRRNSQPIMFLFRLVMFLAKVMTLARPCWPFMVDIGIGIPLIGLAALDLGLPRVELGTKAHPSDPHSLSIWSNWGWRTSSVLLAIHFAALWMVARWGVLCTAARKDWEVW